MTDADKATWDKYYKPRNEAFDKAKVLIAHWETAQGVTPSEPQMSAGKDILANSGLPIVAANDLGDAAKKIVAEVRKAA
jgi:hypothetical protein